MRRAMLIAFLVALACVLFTNRSETIFGADASGYANLARMLAAGETEHPVPLGCTGCDPRWFIPLGFVPLDGAMVAQYPPGVPLHLALASRLGGWQHAPFFVSPLAALALVFFTYRIGLRVHSELAGLIAAVLMGLCAVLIFQALQPMSDVLAAMWCAAAIAAALEGRERPAFTYLAGLAFGIAVLVRPTSALMLLPLALATGNLKAMLRFAIGGVPAAIALAWYNASAFDSLLTSGYTATNSVGGGDFALTFFRDRAVHYLRWTVQQFSPLAAIAMIGGLVLLRRRDRVMLVLWFAVFFLCYSFYRWYDTWWYTRFLLPGYPPIAVAAGIGFSHVVARPRLRVLATMAVVVAFAWQLHQNASLAVLFTDEDQHRVRIPPEWIARALPPRSIVLSMEYSGALLYYSDHLPVRWDIAPPERVRAFLGGRPAYALLMQHEEEPFLARYGDFRRVRMFEGGTLFVRAPVEH